MRQSKTSVDDLEVLEYQIRFQTVTNSVSAELVDHQRYQLGLENVSEAIITKQLTMKIQIVFADAFHSSLSCNHFKKERGYAYCL